MPLHPVFLRGYGWLEGPSYRPNSPTSSIFTGSGRRSHWGILLPGMRVDYLLTNVPPTSYVLSSTDQDKR